MKWRSKVAAIGLAVLAMALSLHAEPISQLRPTNYVNDFAGVLDASTQARLNDLCRQVDEKAHAQIAVVTVKSVDGQDVVSYAVALYQKWGIGAKGKDRGVLILLAVQDRKYWTTVGYGLEPILPDGKVGGFGREAVPFLRAGDYAGAVTLMTSRVAEVIARDAGVTLEGAQAPARNRAGCGAARGSAWRRDRHRVVGDLYPCCGGTFPGRRGPIWSRWRVEFPVGTAVGNSVQQHERQGRRVQRRRLGWRRLRRRRRWLRWFWRRQHGWWRGRRQLVRWRRGAMVPETNINDFAGRLKEAAGTNLVSIILYGSAAAGDYVADHSDVNLLCVLRDTSFASLQALSPAVEWWRKQKRRTPLVMGAEELRRSADVFSIELLDMQQSYRVLRGEDLLKTLAIPAHFRRVQLEYELREKTILLRQGLLSAAGNAPACGNLCCAHCRLLPPCSVMLCLNWGSRQPSRSGRRCKSWRHKLGFDAAAFLELLDIREHKAGSEGTADVNELFMRYLKETAVSSGG